MVLLPSQLALLSLQLDLIEFDSINPVVFYMNFSRNDFEDELCLILIDCLNISVNIVLFAIVNFVHMIFSSYLYIFVSKVSSKTRLSSD